MNKDDPYQWVKGVVVHIYGGEGENHTHKRHLDPSSPGACHWAQHPDVRPVATAEEEALAICQRCG